MVVQAQHITADASLCNLMDPHIPRLTQTSASEDMKSRLRKNEALGGQGDVEIVETSYDTTGHYSPLLRLLAAAQIKTIT